MEILGKIYKYQKDNDYFQELMTIVTTISSDDIDKLAKLLEEAEKKGKRLYIDDSNMKDWLYDSITFDMIKMK